MEDSQTVLTSSDNPDAIAPEQPLAAPHFDEISIQNARPAVPLAQVRARPFSLLAVVLMCVSSVVGAVIGITLSRYENRSVQISKPAASITPEESGVSANNGPGSPRGQPAWGGGSDRIVKSTANESERIAAVANTENKTNDVEPAASKGTAESTRAVLPREDRASGSEPTSDTQGGNERATLNGALDQWIAATNARDIQRQMDFYNQTVNAFYLTRNVPREAVRAEKSRVFGRAKVIDIRAAAPGIRLSRDGRTATMRFRKKYAIEGDGEDRRGEVLQELRWRRTDDGWKIVSERDLRVIR